MLVTTWIGAQTTHPNRNIAGSFWILFAMILVPKCFLGPKYLENGRSS